MRFFAMCSLFLLLLLPGGYVGQVTTYESITDSFSSVQTISVIEDDKTKILNENSNEFKNIIKTLKEVVEYSHDMPAFGVSIDNLTREEIKTGVWLELGFKNTGYFNEMPFDALLIKVEKDVYGFNLIRKYNGKYDGRCFYLSLNGSMNKLYNIFA